MRIMSDKAITREEVESQIEAEAGKLRSKVQIAFYIAVGSAISAIFCTLATIAVIVK